MPVVAEPALSSLQLAAIICAELLTPPPNRFIGYDDAAFRQKILDVSEAKAETIQTNKFRAPAPSPRARRWRCSVTLILQPPFDCSKENILIQMDRKAITRAVIRVTVGHAGRVTASPSLMHRKCHVRLSCLSPNRKHDRNSTSRCGSIGNLHVHL